MRVGAGVNVPLPVPVRVGGGVTVAVAVRDAVAGCVRPVSVRVGGGVPLAVRAAVAVHVRVAAGAAAAGGAAATRSASNTTAARSGDGIAGGRIMCATLAATLAKQTPGFTNKGKWADERSISCARATTLLIHFSITDANSTVLVSCAGVVSLDTLSSALIPARASRGAGANSGAIAMVMCNAHDSGRW